MAEVLAKVMVGADDHLCSKNYGAHRDYAEECLEYFRLKTRLMGELGITHYIGLGDLSFGRFTTLEFRMEVEKELQKQLELTCGRRWELKGNHDKASFGMTEYEYYLEKGMFKPAECLEIGNVRLNMIDYGREYEKGGRDGLEGRIIQPREDTIDIILGHNYFCNTDRPFGQFGKGIDLSKMHDWLGVNYIISGHVHNPFVMEAHIEDFEFTKSSTVLLQYPGCMARPAYTKNVYTTTALVVLTIYDNGEIEYESKDIELWPVEKSFNLEAIAEKKEKDEEKHIDISDVTAQLDTFKVGCGSPEEIINGMVEMPERYRKKALELLENA